MICCEAIVTSTLFKSINVPFLWAKIMLTSNQIVDNMFPPHIIFSSPRPYSSISMLHSDNYYRKERGAQDKAKIDE